MKCAQKKKSPAAKKKESKLLSISRMNDGEKNELLSVLLENRAVQLHVVNEFSHHFIPPSLPTRLNSLYNPEFANGKSFEEILAECRRLKENLVVTREEAKQAEKLTIKQSATHYWHEARLGYCTASSMRQVCRTDVQKPSTSLIKKICFRGKPIRNAAIE